MQEFTALQFYKAQQDLPAGSYKVFEHDDSVSIATINSHGEITWRDVEDFETFEQEQLNDAMWAADGMDMVLGYPD